jgi:hypothetical protein
MPTDTVARSRFFVDCCDTRIGHLNECIESSITRHNGIILFYYPTTLVGTSQLGLLIDHSTPTKLRGWDHVLSFQLLLSGLTSTPYISLLFRSVVVVGWILPMRILLGIR